MSDSEKELMCLVCGRTFEAGVCPHCTSWTKAAGEPSPPPLHKEQASGAADSPPNGVGPLAGTKARESIDLPTLDALRIAQLGANAPACSQPPAPARVELLDLRARPVKLTQVEAVPPQTFFARDSRVWNMAPPLLDLTPRQESADRPWTCAVCGGRITYKTWVGEMMCSVDLQRTESLPLFDPRRNYSAGNAARTKRDAATDGRLRVKWEIVLRIHDSGTFSAGGIVAFWRLFPDELCGGCTAKLNELANVRETAKKLLSLAVEFDPNNSTIKQNLGALG